MKQTFVVSDESVNSYGLIVKTDGIDTSRFLKNPIMLYGHDRDNVIGYWENIQIKDGVMYADGVFDTDTEFSADIARKVEKGFLKATSLGIDVLESDDKFIYKSELHEISIVPIGANSNTLKMYSKPELLKLNFKLNTVDLKQSIIAMLGLDSKATDEEILKEVETLLNVKKDAEDQKEEQIQQELQLALGSRKIDHSTLPHFQKLLRSDFMAGKAILDSLQGKKSIFEQIVAPGSTQSNLSKQHKPKTQWDLNDYRKFAPNELKNNPRLYKDLIDKQNKI